MAARASPCLCSCRPGLLILTLVELDTKCRLKSFSILGGETSCPPIIVKAECQLRQQESILRFQAKGRAHPDPLGCFCFFFTFLIFLTDSRPSGRLSARTYVWFWKMQMRCHLESISFSASTFNSPFTRERIFTTTTPHWILTGCLTKRSGRWLPTSPFPPVNPQSPAIRKSWGQTWQRLAVSLATAAAWGPRSKKHLKWGSDLRR